MTPQQLAFADYFSAWGLFLPDDAVASGRDGHLRGHGWMVRFRWSEHGALLFRAGHRMTNERVVRISASGDLNAAEPVPPGEGRVIPTEATSEEKARIDHEYRSAWTRHTSAVAAAGLAYDTSGPPAGLKVGAGDQLWRLDDGAWHSDPLRPRNA